MTALAALLVLVTPLQDAAGELEPVRAALRRTFPAEQVDQEALVQRLAALGPQAVPVLYGLATGRRLEELTKPEWRGEAWLCRPEEIPARVAQCARARRPRARSAERAARPRRGVTVDPAA